MKQFTRNVKRRKFRLVMNFLCTCFVVIIGVHAKNQCCPEAPPPNYSEVIQITNDVIYYSGQDDTLIVKFAYILRAASTEDFDSISIYFYGIRGWWLKMGVPQEAVYIRSNDTLVLQSWQYNHEYVDSLFFVDFAPQDSYMIWVRLDGHPASGKAKQGHGVKICDKESDEPTSVLGPSGRQLILLMGNEQVCNYNDVLYDPYAYPLMVQVVDLNGNGINGDSVYFETNHGSFNGQQSQLFETNTVWYIDSTFDGVAGPLETCPFYLPNYPCDIVIAISAYKGNWNEPWATKEVTLKCFYDNEPSGLTAPLSHETTEPGGSVEIPGDGYNDGMGKKTIKVEIDFAANFVIREVVEEAAGYMKKILVTAHLDTLDIIVDDGLSVPDSLDPPAIKMLLKDTRDYTDYIHLFIGSRRAGLTINGEVVAYNLGDWGNFKHARCAHFATTDTSIAHAYQDSTGIFIYAKRIREKMAVVSWDTLARYGWVPPSRTYGICMAHEMGHALGLVDHHTTGVMRDINWRDYSWKWEYFDTTCLNTDPPEDAMNTHDVLGIHTIDVAY